MPHKLIRSIFILLILLGVITLTLGDRTLSAQVVPPTPNSQTDSQLIFLPLVINGEFPDGVTGGLPTPEATSAPTEMPLPSPTVVFTATPQPTITEEPTPSPTVEPTPTEEPEGALVIKIDPAELPPQIELPSFDDEPRPLAIMIDPDGDTATFVENELLLVTDDTAVIERLIETYDGIVLTSVFPSESGLDIPRITLIRINPELGEIDNLKAILEGLDDGEDIRALGEHSFSSEAGAGLMAIAGQQALDGLMVGVNWVGESSAVPLNSFEAATGPDGYSSNAYNWSFMNSGSTQDIGVVDAWNALHHAGKYDNRLRYAILDQGYAPNADFPASTVHFNALFPWPPENVPGYDSPWHGTHVMQTAMAVPSNNHGIVGVAHTVAEPVNIYSGYDFMTSIVSVISARGSGAKVINMSYSAEVPSVVGWTVWPFELTTMAARSSGALLFASAGNDGKNVDAERCFIVCWEKKWHTPCENNGVICVGGIGWDSKDKDDGSNFGREHVDIYAPYTVYAGWAPDRPGGDTNATWISGTSFSSPFAGSVAALIWAADPSLSATQVWNIMVDTAHSSPDSDVNRYVNAYDAVLRAVDSALTVEITAPSDGGSESMGRSIALRADVGYVVESGAQPIHVEWWSSINGILSTDTLSTVNGVNGPESGIFADSLAPGIHTLRFRASAGGTMVEDSITLTVTNTPPTATITQPSSGSEACVGTTVNLRGTGIDIDDLSGLSESAFSWTS
ncbi:MAG: S8 family serine peptidase, partial [Chloroflexota bacterium]